jgi:uncharacterized protein
MAHLSRGDAHVAAAIVMAVAARLVDFGQMTSVVPVVVLAIVVIAVQLVLSRLWLRSFVYGPVEWLWRTATWLRPAALRRKAGVSAAV